MLAKPTGSTDPIIPSENPVQLWTLFCSVIRQTFKETVNRAILRHILQLAPFSYFGSHEAIHLYAESIATGIGLLDREHSRHPDAGAPIGKSPEPLSARPVGFRLVSGLRIGKVDESPGTWGIQGFLVHASARDTGFWGDLPPNLEPY